MNKRTQYLGWAALINAENASGIPDNIVILLTILLFCAGALIGFLFSEYGIGDFCLGAAGGLSVGIRIVLFRDDLLVPVFSVNWVIVGVFGVAGGLLVLFKRRTGIVRLSLQHSCCLSY